jgi:hypothetical protein
MSYSQKIMSRFTDDHKTWNMNPDATLPLYSYVNWGVPSPA